MMRSIKYLIFLFVAVAVTAQTFNNYRRTKRKPYPSATASYYNQFITSGAQGFQSNINALNTNNFTAVINPTASLQKFEYRMVKKSSTARKTVIISQFPVREHLLPERG